MEYVMVPVPEDLVSEVEQFMRQAAAEKQTVELDTETAARLMRDCDPRARGVLLAAAAAAVEGNRFTVTEAAAAAGCSEPEVLGLLVILNKSVVVATGTLAVVPMLNASSDAIPLVVARNVAHRFLAAAQEHSDAGE